MIPAAAKLGKSSSGVEHPAISCLTNTFIAIVNIPHATMISTASGLVTSRVGCPTFRLSHGASSLFCAQASTGVESPHIFAEMEGASLHFC